MPEKHHPTPEERDERMSLPLPPEVAIPALLQVDPESDPVPTRPEDDKESPAS